MTEIQMLEYFLTNPGTVFSILIMGERGTGKTKWVKQIAEEKLNKKVIVANCASFSDDTMAESILFGHKKGAYTGAIDNYPGLFKRANNGVLFLDEVHTLSFRVQEKLMTALQTNSSGSNKGKFCIRSLGEAEDFYVELRPVFASNLKLHKLKEKILPDLYDRISQLVLEFPSIHEKHLDVYEEFKAVWKNFSFREYSFIPQIKVFKDWIYRIPLDGNYRTLESIAINWHQGRLIFYNEENQRLKQTSDILADESKEEKIFEFVRDQFNKFHSSTAIEFIPGKLNFKRGVSKKQFEKEFQKALYDWAVSPEGYGSPTSAQKGLSVSRLKNPHK